MIGLSIIGICINVIRIKLIYLSTAKEGSPTPSVATILIDEDRAIKRGDPSLSNKAKITTSEEESDTILIASWASRKETNISSYIFFFLKLIYFVCVIYRQEERMEKYVSTVLAYGVDT